MGLRCEKKKAISIKSCVGTIALQSEQKDNIADRHLGCLEGGGIRLTPQSDADPPVDAALSIQMRTEPPNPFSFGSLL